VFVTYQTEPERRRVGPNRRLAQLEEEGGGMIGSVMEACTSALEETAQLRATGWSTSAADT
jgi:hypothetical protein